MNSDASDDDSKKKKNSKPHSASTKPGNSTGLLSGSYLSTAGSTSSRSGSLKEVIVDQHFILPPFSHNYKLMYE